METAAEVAKRGLVGSGSELSNRNNPSKQAVPQRVIDRLFMRFQAIYRQKWSSQFNSDGEAGEAAYRVICAEWSDSLAGLSNEEIAAGLERMKSTKTHAEWPPNPIEFRRLCRPHREIYQRPEFGPRALPGAVASRESALRHLANIRKRLGG